jgi:hypothetical protein
MSRIRARHPERIAEQAKADRILPEREALDLGGVGGSVSGEESGA